MGWLIGIAGNISESDLQKIKSVHPESLHKFKSDKIYIAAGGIPETCLGSISDGKGWLVCGLGIYYKDNEASFLNAKDWGTELSQKAFNQYKLNGHFAVIRWDENKLELFTDQLGIRKLYLTKVNNSVIFSTRPDWLAGINKNISIDWEEFGSRWLLFNQVSAKSFLKNIESLNQGGKALINLDHAEINVSNQPWHPDLVPESYNNDYASTLKSFTLCSFKNKKTSLALSGGIDSRVLLSFLLSSENNNWCVHSFLFKDHPDTLIANKISTQFIIEHLFIEPKIPEPGKIISYLNECIGETILASPASKFLLLQFYSDLHEQNKIGLDGAYGELARRRFLNRFLVKGKEALLKRDSEKIVSLLRYNRSHIFNQEYLSLMEKGMKNQMEENFHSMPDIKDFGAENWLDLFVIRNRFVQSSVEQARSDSMLVNFMPFAQPAFLKIVFNTPVGKRNNSRVTYNIIENNYPELKKIPLVKGNIIYPFGLNYLLSSTLIKIKNKMGGGYKDDLQTDYLLSLKEFVYDSINSEDFLSCEYYDHNKIEAMINSFYKEKKYSLAGSIDWWLTFEIWRRKFKTRIPSNNI